MPSIVPPVLQAVKTSYHQGSMLAAEQYILRRRLRRAAPREILRVTEGCRRGESWLRYDPKDNAGGLESLRWPSWLKSAHCRTKCIHLARARLASELFHRSLCAIGDTAHAARSLRRHLSDIGILEMC